MSYPALPPQGQEPTQGYPPQGQQGYPPQGQPLMGAYPPQQPMYPPQGQGEYPPQAQQPMPTGYAAQPAPGMMMQPTGQAPPGGEWMAAAPNMAPPPNCPPALAYLSQVDYLFVKQQVEYLEVFSGFETGNKYKVQNGQGMNVFAAVEDSDCCSRNMCGPNRGFDMKILDNSKHEVMTFHRPLACNSCCWYPCSHQTMEVSCPPGSPIGSISKDWSLLKPIFTIKDAAGSPVLKIEGPMCTMAMCGEIEFKVLTADRETEVGKISKEWSGFGKEMFTDADNFGVNFPMDLDPQVKATLLAAVFLIDFLYFEKKQNE